VITDQAVRVEQSGPVSTIFLDRPARRNAVDGPAAVQLAAAFRAFDADPGAAVAVLHGEGGVFYSGADLTAMGTERGNRVAAEGDGPMGVSRLRLSKPVIAGYAVAGGLELSPPSFRHRPGPGQRVSGRPADPLASRSVIGFLPFMVIRTGRAGSRRRAAG
jgi:enoyl-CoA hydratase/carnithine racemase